MNNNFDKTLNELYTSATGTRSGGGASVLGGRVIVDSARFRSGRDPGRRREQYSGTVKKVTEDGCVVEFDKAVTVKGKKVTSMHMKNSYLKPLVEDD